MREYDAMNSLKSSSRTSSRVHCKQRCLALWFLGASKGACGVTLFLITSSTFAAEVVQLQPINVDAQQESDDSTDVPLGATTLESPNLESERNKTGDSARLLLESPTVSLYGNGGISSLPVIHGLADDRLRIQVDGAEFTTACPNHMNSPLSYMDPAKVGKITVFAGVTPVSVGGDSIGGTIQVDSPPPQFATGEESYLAKGQLGSFYRSNGDAFGYHFRGNVAGRWLSLSYNESRSQSDNYVAGRSFKPVSSGREGALALPGNEVGSSGYEGALDRSVTIAAQHAGHVLQLELGQQTVDFEGFPSQRMDMTANDNRVALMRYQGQFAWGELLGRASYQITEHQMDMGPDRYSYGTGMPMHTKAKTRAAMLQSNVYISETDTVRVGAEYQYYTLFDWWDPVGMSGSMAPNTFWNIDYGQRSKFDTFVEWEASWHHSWVTQLGVRHETVLSDAGPVQGYDNSFDDVWAADAARFNASPRQRTDQNWDATALVRYSPKTQLEYTLGFARKSRSPNLYPRYPWATNSMAALMNNLVGDGNGYVGNVHLNPEVASTISLTGSWHDAARGHWELVATSYYTYVHDFIDAKRCDISTCASSAGSTQGFVILQFVNQTAQLHGIDLTAKLQLAKSARFGSLTGATALSYVRGRNVSTGDDLYNIMPANARLTLLHAVGGWNSAAEITAVANKSHVSQVRNEIPTPGFWLLNLRGGYKWAHARVDVSIENVLNRFYFAPLGGAYVGQGPSMTTNGIPWGVAVPGRGRSLDLAFNYEF